MAGKRPSEAVHNFVDPLQRSISCVSDAVLRPSPNGWNEGGPHGLTIPAGPAQLRGCDLVLVVAQQYEVKQVQVLGIGPWKVSTLQYGYAIVRASDPPSELINFHWHPEVDGTPKRPHLHVHGGDLERLHIPTGRVSLEQVIRLAIEMGAQPIRDDWTQVLDESQNAHEKSRTWHYFKGD